MMKPFRWRDLLLGACAGAIVAAGVITTFKPAPAPMQASAPPQAGGEKTKEPTPEEKMAMRMPQPVRVRDIVGHDLLGGDRTLGVARRVVRTPDGKTQLVVNYGAGLFGLGARLIAVPVEVVAWVGPDLVNMDWEDSMFELAPTWYAPEGTAALQPDDTIRLAITRR